jgi:hypothetical protein
MFYPRAMVPNLHPTQSDTVRIGKGEYYGAKFRGPVGGVVETSVMVQDGPKVDLYLTDERGYQNYTEGRQFNEYEESPTTPVKRANIRKSSSGKVYVLIIENNGGSGLGSMIRRKNSPVNLKIATTG